MDTAPQTDSNGPPAPLLTLGDHASMAGQYEGEAKMYRVLSCVRIGALRFGQNVLEMLARAEESRQGMSRKLVTWRGTPFATLALRVLSPFDVEETDQEARLRNFAVAVEDYATFYAFLKKNGLKLSKDAYERRYDIGEKLLEAFLRALPALAALSPTQPGGILVVERQDAMEAFEEWARDNYGHMTLTALEKEFSINSKKAKQLAARVARAARETAAREASIRDEADQRVAAAQEDADRRVAEARRETETQREAAAEAQRVAAAETRRAEDARRAVAEDARRAEEAPRAEAEQRAEVARREAPPARIEVPRVESDSDSDFEPEPPKRSEKKRKRASTSGGGDNGQGAAKRRRALDEKTEAYAFAGLLASAAVGVGWYAFRG